LPWRPDLPTKTLLCLESCGPADALAQLPQQRIERCDANTITGKVDTWLITHDQLTWWHCRLWGLMGPKGSRRVTHVIIGIGGAYTGGLDPRELTVFNGKVLFPGTDTADNKWAGSGHA